MEMGTEGETCIDNIIPRRLSGAPAADEHTLRPGCLEEDLPLLFPVGQALYRTLY